MPSIPQIKIGNTTYDVKDSEARDRINILGNYFVPRITWLDKTAINASGNNESNNRSLASKEYIDIYETETFDFRSTDRSKMLFNVALYDSNKNFVRFIMANIASACTISGLTGFIRFTMYKNDASITSDQAIGYLQALAPLKVNNNSIDTFEKNENGYNGLFDYVSNTLDHFNITWYLNHYIDDNGVMKTNGDAMISVMLRVEPDRWYQLNADRTIRTPDGRIAFYNQNFEFVGSTFIQPKDIYVKTPSNAAYARISANKNRKAVEIFVRADHVKDPAYSMDTAIHISPWFANRYYSANGDVSDTVAAISDFVGIDATTEYRFVGGSPLGMGDAVTLLYYDTSKTLLSSEKRDPVRNFKFTTPENCAYIRIECQTQILDERLCYIQKTSTDSFSITDYIEKRLPKTKGLLQAPAKNILPLGKNYDPETFLTAFTRQDVSSEIISRGVDAPCVFWDSIEGRWGMTFTAYRQDDVSEYGSIYAAHSDDLENWVQDGVIIERDLSLGEGGYEYGTVGGSYVFIKNRKYYVYYNGGSVRGFETGKYCICVATGTSLSNLTKYSGNPLLVGSEEGKWFSKEKLYRPSVIQWQDGTYYMFFNARNSEIDTADGRVPGSWHEYIGYAVSTDLLNWEVQGRAVYWPERQQYMHFVTGDPSFYDIGDEYIYATIFTCFSQNEIDWSQTGIGIMRTLKEDFPLGWEVKWNTVTGHPKNKAYIVYKNGTQYAFMVDTGPAVYYRKAES